MVTQGMLRLNGCPSVNIFAGLNNEKGLIMIYHYKQTHEDNKPKKGENKISIKKNISNITEKMKSWLFHFACVTSTDYFHKDNNYGKLIPLICWNNWLT